MNEIQLSQPQLSLKDILNKRYTTNGKEFRETNGKTYQARDEETNQKIMIKVIKNDDSNEDGIQATCLREIAILKTLQHTNIIKMLEYHVGTEGCYIVYENCDKTLESYINTFSDELPLSSIQLISKQLLEALLYLHSHKIIHRNINPSNILFSHSQTIKLSDFSVSRVVSIPMRKYTQEVVKTWYKAPELLLGKNGYGYGIDIWAVGCVIAEMILSEPLFMGECKFGQLMKIFRILGTPNETTWPGISQYCYFNSQFPQFKENKLAEKVGRSGKDGIDLLNNMLCCYPNKRINAKDALNHPFITYFN